MKKVFLLSDPDKRKGFSKEICKYLKSELDGKQNLVAISVNPDNYEKNDKYFYGTDDSLGVINMFKHSNINIKNYQLIDSRITSEDSIKMLNKADIIYLLGGNHFKQIEYIKNNNLENILKEHHGILVWGVSAGSMNLAKHAYYSKDEELPESTFYEGLGIVDLSIVPYFDINNISQVEEAIKMSNKHKIIGLPNDSAIVISNNDTIYR